MKTDVIRKDNKFHIAGNIKLDKKGFSDKNIADKRSVYKNIFIILMVLGCMMGSFSHTAFSSLLETIMKEFSLSAFGSQWMTAAYSMTIGVTTILSVFLTKNFDKTKLFFYSMLIFCSGVILSALSFNYVFIIIGRILQATGSGIILTLSQVILLSAYSKEKTGIVMGIYGFLLNLSSAVAPVITLLLARKISWQMILWGICGIVVVILSVQLCMYILQKKCAGNNVIDNEKNYKNLKEESYFYQEPAQTDRMLLGRNKIIKACKKFKKFDFISFGLSGISIVLFMIGFTSIREIKNGNSMVKSVLFVLTGVIFMAFFIVRQRKREEPYINLKIFKNKKFTIVVLTGIFIYAVMMGTALWFPVYIKRIAEADMQRVGIIMLPGALLMAVSSALGGWLYQKYGARLIYAISICSFVVAVLTRNIVPLWVLFSMRSVGIGIIMMSMVAWGMKDIEKDKYSDGTAIICSLRTVAGAFGTALAAMLM